MRNPFIALLATTAVAFLLLFAVAANRAAAAPVSISTGNPDGLIATLSRPPSAGKIETETADDFILTQQTTLNTASFTGLLTGTATTANINRVGIDIYRVFPNESDTVRTITVPTRTNSPGDVELVGRDTVDNDMTFTATLVSPTFNAANSIVNGIHASPAQTTGGEGPVSGAEVRIDVTFTSPLNLAADHYFFRPEVGVDNGDFLWLSAPKPIVPPGTSFSPDLQSWIRNETIAPDWIRIGTDAVGVPAGSEVAPTFNASFTITGETTAAAIPLPAGAWMGITMVGALMALKRRVRSIV